MARPSPSRSPQRKVRQPAPPPAPPGHKRVLVVDDEESTRVGLAELIESWGFDTETAEDGRTAIDRIRSFRPNLIVLDLLMPRMDGLSLLRRVDTSDTAVLILTAQGTINSAVEAIKNGAYDYLTKPVDIVRLKNLLERLAEKMRTDDEVKRLRAELRRLGSFGRLIGATQVMQDLFAQIEVAAPTTAPVLISGASGTGKELVARAVHDHSPRKNGPFVAINCSAIPATLLESELFGHEKGAFTGAVRTTRGCFELADHGTLFLDEIATMAMDLQSKLLRALENGRFRRVGGKEEICSDIRLIAASNIEFREAIESRLLREDLYYRLNVFELHLPPLSDRVGDIPILVQSFIDELSRQHGKDVLRVSPEAQAFLSGYPWPGNVRELRNTIERAVIVCRSQTIGIDDLPESLRGQRCQGPAVSFPVGTNIEEMEMRMILRTLDFTGGNKTETAKLLGISLKTLHNKLGRRKRAGSK